MRYGIINNLRTILKTAENKQSGDGKKENNKPEKDGSACGGAGIHRHSITALYTGKRIKTVIKTHPGYTAPHILCLLHFNCESNNRNTPVFCDTIIEYRVI